MLINYDKPKSVHFRSRNMPRSQVNFKCGEKPIQFAESYRYLGCELDEYLDFTHTSSVLAEASRRSLWYVVNKHKLYGGMYYELYKKSYDTFVIAVMDYCGAVWGFKVYDKCNTTQNWVIIVTTRWELYCGQGFTHLTRSSS